MPQNTMENTEMSIRLKMYKQKKKSNLKERGENETDFHKCMDLQNNFFEKKSLIYV